MAPRTPLPPQLRHRAFTTSEAASYGITGRRLNGADLRSPLQGVWVSADVHLTLEMLAAAALTRISRGFACGLSAAALWGAPLPRWCERQPLEVAVSSGRAPTGRGLTGRVLAIAPMDLRLRSGIRLTSAARTWVDISTRLALRDLIAVGDFIVRRRSPLASRDELAAAVAQHGRGRGAKALRAALPLLSDRSESRKETHLRLILVAAGLGDVVANLWITTLSGHRYRADLAIPGKKVLLEYQSEFHFDPERQMNDMVRRSRLQASGWIVIEVNKADLVDPRDLISRIHLTLAQR